MWSLHHRRPLELLTELVAISPTTVQPARIPPVLSEATMNDRAATDSIAPAPGGELSPYAVQLRSGTRTAQHPTRDDIALLGLDFNADPLDRLAWMRANAPVYWDDGTGLWGITRHADIMRIEADATTFCSALGSRPESSVPSMINKDEPEHTARRRLVSAGFTLRRVRQHEGFLRGTVDGLVDEVIEHGSCDVVADIATAIPLRMIAKLMDLPEADFDRLVHWSDLFATGGPEVRRSGDRRRVRMGCLHPGDRRATARK